ncbi:hypothetical protein [Dactylosporangium darangshiense]|uniref:Uncharacterized protein n=1 Tax=Dactylosporangium darangshiense TaxID=579108 RepID=A0ABP8DU74_9ACTN
MRLFRGTRRPRFPADIASWLENFGRYTLDIHHSGVDGMAVVTRFDALRDYATTDPDGFLVELRTVVAGDDGGFATFGAACLVWQMLDDCLEMPAALPLIDAGLDFKLERGLPPGMFNANEMLRLAQRRGQQG